jgi:hypothetical protein
MLSRPIKNHNKNDDANQEKYKINKTDPNDVHSGRNTPLSGSFTQFKHKHPPIVILGKDDKGRKPNEVIGKLDRDVLQSSKDDWYVLYVVVSGYLCEFFR